MRHNAKSGFSVLFMVLCTIAASAQTMYVDSLFSANDSLLDVYQYQIPEGYNPDVPAPLLVGWHQWGGSYGEFMYTPFAAEANTRGWIALGAWGGHSMNWTNQDTQEWMQLIIETLTEQWNIDWQRIYMVGGSMGGASGMIYSNNHLDPTRPMVAASASASGILDDERRFIEQGINNSMIEVFGGTWEEVPFTYHRNSAIYFADSLNSMHSNLWHSASYLTYGTDETYHQYHALDLYEVLARFADDVYIGATVTGHGWGVFDVPHVCDWLEQYMLNSDPDTMAISADEDSRNYWTGVSLAAEEVFGLYSAQRSSWSSMGIRYELDGLSNIAEFYLEEFDNADDPETPLQVVVGSADSEFTFGFIRNHLEIETAALLTRNGETVWDWEEWPLNDTLSLNVAAYDTLELVFIPEAVAPETAPVQPRTRLEVLSAANSVQINWGAGPAVVVVYDLLGRELNRMEANRVPLLLKTNGFASGVYFLQAETEQGVQFGRFLVQH
jgi:pimeloyl-ACP methyl ester carboxylesterase